MKRVGCAYIVCSCRRVIRRGDIEEIPGIVVVRGFSVGGWYVGVVGVIVGEVRVMRLMKGGIVGSGDGSWVELDDHPGGHRMYRW